MTYLLDQENFVKALEAVKSCQDAEEPLYHRLVERTVGQLVSEWRQIRKEFKAKRNQIRGLSSDAFWGKCEDKEFAAVSSLGDFKSKLAFLSSLSHACQVQCQWNGHKCVSKAEESSRPKMNSSVAAYDKCYAELVAGQVTAQLTA